ncbi:MAG: hypothetical protein HYY62_08770 [Deltaproteobacteria bacterium]|nr:hypothetical protein [Deltaproteobacteria bacterium]
MSRIVVGLVLAVCFTALPTFAQNDAPKESLIQSANQFEVLEALIASIDSQLATALPENQNLQLINYQNQLIQTKENVESEVKDFNRLLSLRFLKGLMDVEPEGESIYLSSLGKTKEAFLSEYSFLEQKFQNDPIYQKTAQSLNESLLLLQRAKAGEDISSALSQVQDETQRALIQKIWDEIKQKKQKQEELFHLTGKKEVDWNTYYLSINSGVRVGELLVLDDYYTKVNQVYPKAKKEFAISLLSQVSTSRQKTKIINELSQNQNDISDANLSKTLKLFQAEHENISDPVMAPHRRGFSPLQAQIGGNPTVNPFISQEFLGITAISFGYGAVTVPLICIAGPMEVLLLTSVVTVLQIDDEYYFSQEGLNYERGLGERFLDNLIPVAFGLAGFRGLKAISPALAKLSLFGLSGYLAYHHFKSKEFFQGTFSALIAGMTAYQGIKYVQFLRQPETSQSLPNENNLKIIIRSPPEGEGWEDFGNDTIDTSSWGRPNPFGSPRAPIRTEVPVTTETSTQTSTQTSTYTIPQSKTFSFAKVQEAFPTPELIPFLVGGIEIDPHVLPITQSDLEILTPQESSNLKTYIQKDDTGNITGFFVGEDIETPNDNSFVIYRFSENGQLEGIEIVKDGKSYLPIRPQDRVFFRRNSGTQRNFQLPQNSLGNNSGNLSGSGGGAQKDVGSNQDKDSVKFSDYVGGDSQKIDPLNSPQASSERIIKKGTPEEVEAFLEEEVNKERFHFIPESFFAYFPTPVEAKFSAIILSSTDRELHRLRYRDKKFYVWQRYEEEPGKLVSIHEVLADTRNGYVINTDGDREDDGKAIYVMDEHGEVFILSERQDGKWHHISLLGRVPVYSVGEISLEEGVIQYIDNNSGHYKPGDGSTTQLQTTLYSRYRIEFKGTTDNKSQQIRIQVPIPGSIHETSKLEFSPRLGSGERDNYLMQQIPDEPVEFIFGQLQRILDQFLVPAPEARIIVITPSEYNRSFKGVITMDEINDIAIKENIQRARFKILGVGRGQIRSNGKPEQTFFLVLESEDLLEVRRKVYDLFMKRGGDPQAFDPEHYSPHIRIAYTSQDYYQTENVQKDSSVIFLNIYETWR